MDLQLAARDYDDPQVRALVTEVQQEYVVRYGAPDAAVVDPAEFRLPDGLFLLASIDGRPVATGGWRRLDPRTAEIKRMYVRAAHRRQGLSRRVLAALEATAGAQGVQRLVLNTGPAQPEAIALYETSGYQHTAPFGHYADHRDAVFYGKDLRAERAAVGPISPG